MEAGDHTYSALLTTLLQGCLTTIGLGAYYVTMGVDVGSALGGGGGGGLRWRVTTAIGVTRVGQSCYGLAYIGIATAGTR